MSSLPFALPSTASFPHQFGQHLGDWIFADHGDFPPGTAAAHSATLPHDDVD